MKDRIKNAISHLHMMSKNLSPEEYKEFWEEIASVAEAVCEGLEEDERAKAKHDV